MGTTLQSRDKALIALLMGATVLSLWLRTGFPVQAIAASDFDDMLFIRLARQIGAGEWLGAYNNTTHAKGMFYPLFIAASAAAALPLKTAEHMLYLAAAGALAWMVIRLTGLWLLSAVLYIALAFNPVLWSGDLARVAREGAYVGLSLLLFAASLGAVFHPERKARLLWGGTAGLAGSAFWLTREEGVWLLPALAVVVLIAALSVRPVSKLFLPITAAVIVCGAGLGSVALLNYKYYGVFQTNDFHQTAFREAYGALARIKNDVPRRYVVFPKDARERAYAVSAAARELQPALEGEVGKGWLRTSCALLRADPCPEIHSGWFMWALRDAVAAAGHYRNAEDARAFYSRLANEINAACDAKRLPCNARRGLAPPTTWSDVEPALEALWRLGRIAVTLGAGDIGSPPSTGDRRRLEIIADTVGTIAASQSSRVYHLVQGWVATREEQPIARLVKDNGPELASIRLMPSEDVARAYPGWRTIRFQAEGECSETCLLVAGPSSDPVRIPHADLRTGLVTNQAGVRVYIEHVAADETQRVTEARRALQLAIARPIARAYAWIMPPLLALGAVGLVIGSILGVTPPVLLAVAWGAAAACAGRLGLLAYLDATSIPFVGLLYVSPATPFVIILALIGSFLGLRSLGRLVTGQSSGN